ncbi:uncharacterized protein BX663DRAFT_543886 [Cokeromyces recurvatus]|uniref:uncharacterized protein n=1 Tax=Cokeromyces recurvatus TaxID=90255 RepID=UPI00221F7B80|nr:uncharacterized protein BX663DRAFT_543886 [Cokeromyces recurvatus]KAI7901985.1 hypothetical protein BX663DRAFT_543886 [Cokeromyces recurvatus]
MPIRAAKTIVKKLSNYYYNYGKLVSSRTYLLLLFSLSFISYFSLPIISKYFHHVVSSNSNIPLSHISTSLDSQCWHASAHVQFNNFTLNQQPPTTYLIAEQIRLSLPDQSVNFELIEQAKKIYEMITTTVVNMDGEAAPVSLATICYQHRGHCLILAPSFNQLKDEPSWRSKTYIHHYPEYDTHPYSVYSNATFDSKGMFIKADAVLLTFILNQTQHGNSVFIWNKILEQVKLKLHILDIQQEGDSFIWSASSNILPQMIQYKFNLLPYDISYKVQISILVYIGIFFLVSYTFGKSNLVKSGYTFGLASIFLSIACFTTTWGIFDKLGMSFHSVPWYLLLLVINIGSLENIFLLTNAVIDAGCDMIVKEKINRGLQNVGVPMTATLTAELLILHIGSQMDTELIKEFCVFAKMALLVDFILEMTFTIAILSIDIKRVELADLDDRQMSKRLHELSGFDFEKERQNPDFCPIQDTKNKEDSKSCAECKDFKTHRVYNAFMLCLIVLALSLFCSKEKHSHTSLSSSNTIEQQAHFFNYQPDLSQLSDQFWSTVNPQKDITWLQIQPPQLIIYDSDIKRAKNHLNRLQYLYQMKSMSIRYKAEHRSSLFRMFIFSILQKFFTFILSINIPIFILCLVMIGIITWMTPKWRKQWLVPLLIRYFNQMVLTLIRWFPLRCLYYTLIKGQAYEGLNKEYDADGIHHRGAIAVQNIFNQQQYRSNVKTVQIRTLSHQHVADIQGLDANAGHSLVSCGQDGRIILWNASPKKATWAARLDKLFPIRGGGLQATLNPFLSSFDKRKLSVHHHHQQQQRKKSNQAILLSKNYLSKPRCVKMDQGNKWIAAGYDNGMIRVWNANTGLLFREMDIHPHTPSVEVQQESSSHLRHRFNQDITNAGTFSNLSFTTKKKGRMDPILSIRFMGAIAEYCHPIIAEAAARCRTSDTEESQNFIISAHKSGVIHEWNILSGECIQTVKTGHTKEITQLHVVDSKVPHRKLGVTWVFTASKDGTVNCWERRLVVVVHATKRTAQQDTEEEEEDLDRQQTTRWTLMYTIKQNYPVTSIATEAPVGGMGILVIGYSDGSVKAWNFETGEPVCTLSYGKSRSSLSNDPLGIDANHVGGPLRQFSKLSNHRASDSSDNDNDDDDDDHSSDPPSSFTSSHSRRISDHHGAIYQVAVTRYCEVENGPGLCRGCDTCFGNGFLIASSSMDNKVHAWRLERADNNHEGTCTLCTKDYHRKQYKHRKTSVSSSSNTNNNNNEDGDPAILATMNNDNSNTSHKRRRRRKSSQHGENASMIAGKRKHMNHTKTNNTNPSEDTLELLDIEQLVDDTHIQLKPTFLGKVDQPAGHGVIFCDKILAGVRRRRRRHHQPQQHRRQLEQSHKEHGEWEAWFASLQYYDPSVVDESGHTTTMKIPLETFILDDPQQDIQLQPDSPSSQTQKSSFFGLFSLSSSSNAGSKHDEKIIKDQLKYKGIHAHSIDHEYTRRKVDKEEEEEKEEDMEEEEEDRLEASENLPFSAVRHIIPLDGSGLACDFGNFIKLVFLQKPSLTEKERLRQTRDVMEDPKYRSRETINEEENSSECQCTEDTCSLATKGKNGCCGGVNKEKNGGQCCGNGKSIKQKQQAIRNQKLLLKKKTAPTNSCSGSNGGNLTECALKNNCSRASECASSNQQALASSISTLSFNHWL